MSITTQWQCYQENEFGQRQVESIVHKFGRNPTIGTSFGLVALGAIYQMPQVAAATKLRVKAGNAADTADGAGARQVAYQGLNTSGEIVTGTLATAGESAGAAGEHALIRLFRFWVSESGTYAAAGGASHVGAVVLENAAGNADWGTISATDLERGQSEIAAYTVPLGFEAYISSINIYVDAGKTVELALLQRQGILDAAAPYDAWRVVLEFDGIQGQAAVTPKTPFGPFPNLTDLIFMAKVAANTAEVAVDFEILLINSAT